MSGSQYRCMIAMAMCIIFFITGSDYIESSSDEDSSSEDEFVRI